MFTLFASVVLGKNTKVVPIYRHNIFPFFGRHQMPLTSFKLK